MNPAPLLPDLLDSGNGLPYPALAAVLTAVLLRRLGPRGRRHRAARHPWRLIAACLAISASAWATTHLTDTTSGGRDAETTPAAALESDH